MLSAGLQPKTKSRFSYYLFLYIVKGLFFGVDSCL